MNLTVSNTNRILRSGNGPTVEYTGQDPIQVNNATHIISLNSAFSAQFAESGVEAKVDELSSCCEQVHSSISSLETQVSSLETQISAISSEIPDTSNFLTKASADTLYQPIGDYLTHDESGAFQPVGDYLLRSESGAFQPSGDYLTVGILNTLATKQEVRITSGFIQGEIDYISGAISAYPNRDELSAAIENIPEYILSGNSNITATSAQDGKNIRWDLRVAATPVVTDTTIVGESGVYAHETSIPGQWQVELTQSAYSAINEVSNKLDKSFSSNFYPMTGNPSGFITQHQDISNLATKDEVSAYTLKTEVSSISSQLLGAISAVSSEIPDVSNFITNISAEQTYQPIGDYAPASSLSDYLTTAQYQVDSATFLTAHQDISNLATKTEVSSYLLKSESGNFYPMNSNPSGYLTAHQSLAGYATTAQVNTVSSLLSAGLDYVSANGGKTYIGIAPIQVNNQENLISADAVELTAGNGLRLADYVIEVTADYALRSELTNTYYPLTGNPSAFVTSTTLSSVSSTLSGAIDYVSANAGITYSAGEGIDISVNGDKTIISNNISAGPGISLVYDTETNKIRIDGEVKEYSGVAPIQVNNTTNQISITGESLSAGPGIDLFTSGGYVVISAQGVNTYCYNFPNGVTSVDLSTFNNYNKVTIVHNNDNMPDYHLYWDGKTKVMPSGLYCEMVKGKDVQNNIKWSFAASGWVNENWWDWD